MFHFLSSSPEKKDYVYSLISYTLNRYTYYTDPNSNHSFIEKKMPQIKAAIKLNMKTAS